MLLLLLSCADPAPTSAPAFPEGFSFGAAIAGFQVDAGCPTLPAEQCEDRGSDWYQWVTDPDLLAEGGLFLSGDPLSNAPGHWELWEEDLERAAGELNLNSLRFSLEWSRLFPDGGAVDATTPEALDAWADPSAVAWYAAYIERMVELGLEPVVTLNHYTLPLWIHAGTAGHFARGGGAPAGWLDPEFIIPRVAAFAGWSAATFGDDVTLWLTLNEPFGVVLPGFAIQDSTRTNPPGIADLEAALGVFEAMARAHGAMADAVHAADPDAQVGVVANVPVPVPYDEDRELDHRGVEHMDYFYNTLFLEAFVNGRFDDDLDGTLDRTDDAIAGRTDFIGLNHYNVVPVVGYEEPLGIFGGGDYPILDFLPAPESLEDLGSLEIDAAIDRVEPYGLPIWITENGYRDPDDGTVDEWLRPNLEILCARAQRTDLRGYLYWSLIDNYEWNLGTHWRFGLYEVDTATKDRALRDVGAFYAEVAASGSVP